MLRMNIEVNLKYVLFVERNTNNYSIILELCTTKIQNMSFVISVAKITVLSRWKFTRKEIMVYVNKYWNKHKNLFVAKYSKFRNKRRVPNKRRGEFQPIELGKILD